MEDERDDGTIPKLMVHHMMTKKDYRSCMDQLDSALSEIKYVDKREVKVIKLIPKGLMGK